MVPEVATETLKRCIQCLYSTFGPKAAPSCDSFMVQQSGPRPPGARRLSSVFCQLPLLLKDLLFDVLAEAERSEAAVTPAGAETIV